MNNSIQKIRYNQELIKNKNRLERELKMIRLEMDKEEINCNHIEVILGTLDSCQVSHCLFCQNVHLFNESTPRIDASNYMVERYGNGFAENQRLGRLEEIQNLWVKYQIENPQLTEEELIIKINDTIKEETPKQLKKY